MRAFISRSTADAIPPPRIGGQRRRLAVCCRAVGHHRIVRIPALDIPDLPAVREVLTLADGAPVSGFDAAGPDALRWWRRLRSDDRAGGRCSSTTTRPATSPNAPTPGSYQPRCWTGRLSWPACWASDHRA